MHATRVLITGMIVGAALWVTGCGNRGGGGPGFFVGGSSTSATEERALTAPHVPASAIDVSTDVGSVEVVADPSIQEVKVAAKVTAFGDTVEQAKARLQDVKIKVSRREDGTLHIALEPAPAGEPLRAACSFVIRIPSFVISEARPVSTAASASLEQFRVSQVEVIGDFEPV